MRKVTNYGIVDSLAIEGFLKVPMVILKSMDIKNKTEVYEGFVPGLLFKLVRAKSLDECELLLKKTTISHIKKMVKENSPFPFFPDRHEIETDFNGVVKIIYLNVNSKIRKNN